MKIAGLNPLALNLLLFLGLLTQPVQADEVIFFAGFASKDRPILREEEVEGEETFQLEPQYGVAIDLDEWRGDTIAKLAGQKDNKPDKIGVAQYFDTEDGRLARAGVRVRLRQWWKNANYTEPKAPEFTVKLQHVGSRSRQLSQRISSKAYETKAEVDLYNPTNLPTVAALEPLLTFTITAKGPSKRAGFGRAILSLFDTATYDTIVADRLLDHDDDSVEVKAQELVSYFDDLQIAMINEQIAINTKEPPISKEDLRLVAASAIKRWKLKDHETGITVELDERRQTYPDLEDEYYEASWKVRVPVSQPDPDEIFRFFGRRLRKLIPETRIFMTESSHFSTK